jgi:hypothetical protein
LKDESFVNNIKKLFLTSKGTQRISMTTVNWFMLFREVIAVYFENHTKNINGLCEQNAGLLNAKEGG